MTIALRQNTDTGVHFPATSYTITPASAPLVGSFLPLALFYKGSTGISGVTDNQSTANTYSKILSISYGAGGVDFWSCPSVVYTAGGFAVTVTQGGSENYLGAIAEFTGLSTGNIDQSNTNELSTSPLTINNSSANSSAGDLVLAACINAIGYTTGATGTQNPPGNNGVGGTFNTLSFYDTTNNLQACASWGYKVETSIVTSSAAWTWSASTGGDQNQGLLATFAPAAAAAIPGPFYYRRNVLYSI